MSIFSLAHLPPSSIRHAPSLIRCLSLSSGPEQHRDSYWGDVRWHCGLQEQGADQLFPMVSDTCTHRKLHASSCGSTSRMFTKVHVKLKKKTWGSFIFLEMLPLNYWKQKLLVGFLLFLGEI